MIVPCAFVGNPQSVALHLPFQNSSFKCHAFHSPPENMEMWVFSLVNIEFHATNQIKKRRHVFQRTYRCCARPCVSNDGLIHAFAVYSVEVISLWTWLQDSRWSALLPCRLTGKLTYRTPWTVSPGTPTRNPTPRRNYRCPSRDTAVTGRRRSLLPEPVRPQPPNIIHYFLYQCVIWISHYFFWYFLVPTASSRFYHIKGRTTYDRHYNDNAENVVNQVRDVGYKLEQEALQKYLEKVEGQGQFHSRATVWARHLPALFSFNYTSSKRLSHWYSVELYIMHNMWIQFYQIPCSCEVNVSSRKMINFFSCEVFLWCE